MRIRKVGQTYSKKRRFSAGDVAAYRDLSGDYDLAFATGSSQSAAVPGPLLGGLVSDILGTELPGKGTNWLKQRYDYKHPAQIEQEIEASVTITRLRPDKGLLNLSVSLRGPSGEILCTGDSLVLVPYLQTA